MDMNESDSRAVQPRAVQVIPKDTSTPSSTADKDKPPPRGSFQALTFNGDITDGYIWSQDKKEVIINLFSK
jgi:hypothetical protein